MAAYALVRFTSPNAGVSVNQAVTDQYIAAAYGLALKNLDVNAVGIAIANAFTSAGTLDLSAASDTAGLKLPSKAGAAPTADGFMAFDLTTHAPWAGFNGTARQLASLTGTETFTNKTLTSPIINVGSDADGDLYYRASGAFTRLPKGTSSQVLFGGTVPAWAVIGNSPTFGWAEAAILGLNTTSTWTSNQARYVPVDIAFNANIVKIMVCIETSSGNLDVGLYGPTGTKLVSAGSTAMGTGGGTVQTITVGSTAVTPGLYYIGVCVDNGTAVLSCESRATRRTTVVANGSVTLPASFTPAGGGAGGVWAAVATA